MSTTQIVELESAVDFNSADVLLIRKNAETKDRKLAQPNFIKSIGNPAVKGFVATSDEANKVTLNPSNGTVIDTYYSVMEVSFLSPINSTGLVQIRLGALPYKDILVLNTNAAVQLTNTSYIQAIYNAVEDKFYQTNPATVQIYTNDYLAEGVLAGDNSSTTYTLTSAIGVPAQSYYNGMSILFTADIASKGAVLVNVDGLGNKTLTDKEGDKIANDLVENQVILAIYNGNSFIKNMFSEEVPEAPEIPADAYDQDGEIVPENVPAVNKLSVTVGNAGNDYTTIAAAIKDLVDNFGDNGGNRLCTINLSNTYTWNEVLVITKNYSWITITTSGVINIAQGCYLSLNGGSITISGSYSDSNVNDKFLNTNRNKCFANVGSKGNVIFSNFNLSTVNGLLSGNDGSYEIYNSIISNKSTANILLLISFTNQNSSNIRNTTINLYARDNNNYADNYFIENSGVLNVVNLTVNSFATNGEYFKIGSAFIYNRNGLTISDSNINVFARVLNGEYLNTYVQNSTLKALSPNHQAVSFSNKATSTLSGCTVSAQSNYSLYATSGANVTVQNGDYRNGTVSNSNNISADGQGTFIRKSGNVLGGTSTTNGGSVINQ